MPHPLRDGTFTLDPRLGALPNPSGSRAIEASEFKPRVAPRSKEWPLKIALYQGMLGSCLPFAFGHALAAAPHQISGGISNQSLQRIYIQIQKSDGLPGGEWDGANPRQGGTRSVDNIAKFKQLGYIRGVDRAQTLNDMIVGIASMGTPVIVTNWYEGMSKPDKNGFVEPSGNIIGRHAYAGLGVDLKQKVFTHMNAWHKPSLPWGLEGKWKIKMGAMEFLLDGNHEIYFLKGEREPHHSR